MASQSVSMAPKATTKMLAHVLKHHQKDCVGVLLGSGLGRGEVLINDVIPLFHERVMTSATEIAFEMIEAYFGEDNQDLQVIGVYDAPIRADVEGNNSQSAGLSPLALNLGEQIKQATGKLDSVIIQVKCPKGEVEDDGSQVREITAAEEENMRSVIVKAFACQSAS